MFAKVGAYVLGNVATSVIAATASSIWLAVFDVPYALLLGIFVGLLDLVPVVGSTIAGVIVAAVALTVSLPVCLATIAFFIVFRLAEDYLLVPKIIGRAVQVPALITMIAIPIAAAVQLIAQEIVLPRLDTY
jgi:predicted PurR-regulated permease PerM